VKASDPGGILPGVTDLGRVGHGSGSGAALLPLDGLVGGGGDHRRGRPGLAGTCVRWAPCIDHATGCTGPRDGAGHPAGSAPAHRRIAVTESLPVTNVAHALSTRITNNGCRSPRNRRGSGACRNRRGSGACRNRSSSDDATDNGSAATASAATEPAASSASRRARSARWSTTGWIGEDDNTSAAPGTIFRSRHPKDPQSRVRPINPALSGIQPRQNTPSRNSAGAVGNACRSSHSLMGLLFVDGACSMRQR
jgi:hypothetical protein